MELLHIPSSHTRCPDFDCPEYEPMAEPRARRRPSRQQSTRLVARPRTQSRLSPTAAAVDPHAPALSYKIDFSDQKTWYVSPDQGKTKTAVGSSMVAGRLEDFLMQVTPTTVGNREYDFRFRVAFRQDETLCEINLNGAGVSRDGNLYVTSPVRSLIGALLQMSYSEDDMELAVGQTRFSLVPGRRGGLFVQVDVADDTRWVAFSSPAMTSTIPQDPACMLRMLAEIKARFRSAGFLTSERAHVGADGSFLQGSHDFVAVAPLLPDADDPRD